MTKRKESNERVCYRLRDIIDFIDNLDPLIFKFILFVHAFRGCDMISAIHNFTKQAVFTKLEASNKLQKIAQQFLLENISSEQLVMHLSASSKNSISQLVVSNKFER